MHAFVSAPIYVPVYPSKDGMLIVQPRRRFECHEKLTAIGIGPGIGHGTDTGSSVLQIACDFIFKLASVDGFATTARARRIPTLNDLIPDNAVKGNTVVIPSVGQGGNVVTCPGCVTVIQFHDK